MGSVALRLLRSSPGCGERRRALLPAALALAAPWAAAGCAPPPCEPPESRCGDECVDLSTDVNHCGACGRACPAGPDELARCAEGVCYRATVLASNQGEPHGIAVDATHVYWASRTDGTIMRAPKSGGEATAVANGQLGAFNVAVDASHAYWSVICRSTWDDCVHAVRKAPLAGGSPTELATAGLGVFIALDEYDVYYCGFELWRVPKSGAGPPASMDQPCQSLVADAQNLYLASTRDIVQIGLVDQSRVTLATGEQWIQSVAVGTTHVYWTEGTTIAYRGQLSKVPIDGGDAVPLVPLRGDFLGAAACEMVAIDETHAYWTVFSSEPPQYLGGRVMKASIHGGEATAIVDGFGRPTCLAADATHVYWTDTVDGLVLRAPK